MAKAIGDDLNCTVTFKFLPWERQHREAAKGNLDLILGVMPFQPLVYVVNSQRFRPDPIAFYWLEETQKKHKVSSITKMIDIDFKIGVLKWDYRSDELEKLVESPLYKRHFSQVNNIKALINNLTRKRVQGGFMHVALAEDYIKKNKVKGLVVNKELSFSKDVYIAYALSSPLGKDFIHKINESLTRLRANGTYNKLIKKHLKSHDLVVDEKDS